MFARDRLEPFSPRDVISGDADYADAEANERACEAMIEARERADFSVGQLAEKLGMSADTLLAIERGQVLDQPTASLLLRAVLECGAKLKISFGRGDKRTIII